MLSIFGLGEFCCQIRKYSQVAHVIFQKNDNVKLDDNEFSCLPKTLTNWRNLECLNVACNNIATLRKEIQQLTNLETIDLSYTKLAGFPNVWVPMEQLKLIICSATTFTRKKNSILPLDIYTESTLLGVFRHS